MSDLRRLCLSAVIAALPAIVLTSCGQGSSDYPYSGTVLRESAAVGSMLVHLFLQSLVLP